MPKPLRYVSDEKLNTAPPVPTDRPPTRAEVWAYVSHVYEGLWDEAKMKAHAKACWAGNYVRWVNFLGWRKKPDWVGDAQLELDDEDQLPGILAITVSNANYEYVKGLMD